MELISREEVNRLLHNQREMQSRVNQLPTYDACYLGSPCEYQNEDIIIPRWHERLSEMRQEPNGDAISRILKRMWNCRGKHTTSIDKVKMEQIIRDELQPAKPGKPILDKIRAEIEHLDYLNIEDGSDGYDKYVDQYDVMKLFDKYKAESEEGAEE